MMAESLNLDREDVLKLYSETRTCIKSNDKELLQRTHAHLANKEANGRFPALDVDLYSLLWKLIKHFDNPDPYTILKIQAGFAHLEQYALNLWRFPWRKEFHVIKTYTGFFKCKVECSLPDMPTAVSLIKCLGYVESKDHYHLKEPLDTEKIQQVSFDLFLVTVDLQIIHELANFAETHGYSLKQAMKARCKTVGGKDEAISWLQCQPKDESVNKKLKLDKDSGMREEPESIGHISNKRPVYNRSEKTLNGQGRSEMELNQEANQRRNASSDRETKFPPSFNPRYPPNSRDDTRDIPSAQNAHSSAFGRNHPQASVSGSNVNLGAVEHKESDLDQLTDDQLYGQGDHSSECHASASEGVERMVFPSFSNGLTTGDQRNTGFSQQLPLSSQEEKLYVNLPEKRSGFTTSTTDVVRHHGVPAAPPTLSPGIPPPTYTDAMMINDYVMIPSPHAMGADPVVTENMCSGELTDEKTEGKRDSYQGYEKYDPQPYESKGSRESELSSINASMSKTLNLDASSTSVAASCASRSDNRDRDIKNMAALHRPGSSSTVPQTGRSEGNQRSASSLREPSLSREPWRSASDEASSPVVEDQRRYQTGRYHPQGARDRKRDKVLAPLQTSTREALTSDRYPVVAGDVQTSLDTPRVTRCELCSLDVLPEFICQGCFKMVCEMCEKIFNRDPCKKTKLPHQFVDMRTESKKTSSLKTWNCLRCTYVNSGELNVCIMCSTTRGLSTPDLPTPGSRVCRGCTYCNKEGSEVCAVCNRPLRLDAAETSV